VTVKTQISRDGDPEQPDLVASCDSVCAQLQSWTQALELGQAVSRPSPKELGLVRVEAQSVGSHPSADIDNAIIQDRANSFLFAFQLLWNSNRKPYPRFRIILFSITLSD